MSITIEVDGVEFIDFISATVRRSVSELSGRYSFVATAREGELYPIRSGQVCKVFVNGKEQINGFVESVRVSYSSREHIIFISGRDLLADFIDSTIGGEFEISGNVSLEDLAKSLLRHMEINTKVINKIPDLKIFTQEELLSPEVNETGFSFLEKFARSRQVFLTGDGNGSLVITRAGTEKATTPLINEIGGANNNIKRARYLTNTSDRYNSYTALSQLNSAGSFEDESSEDMANQEGNAVDKDIRSSRKLFFITEEASSNNIAEERAIWEANIRRARSKNYHVIVAGFAQENGDLWQPNQLVTVSDDFSNIKADMLILDVEFSFNLRRGSVTMLTIAPPDAIQLLAEEPISQTKNDEIGGVFDD